MISILEADAVLGTVAGREKAAVELEQVRLPTLDADPHRASRVDALGEDLRMRKAHHLVEQLTLARTRVVAGEGRDVHGAKPRPAMRRVVDTVAPLALGL